jgi:hypothetical protein
MTCGTPVGFAGLVITNGKGEPLGTTSAPATDTVAPILTAGAVTRTSDTNATVQFKSNEAGKYYYAYVTSGALAPIIVTSGTGTTCTTSMTTVTLTISVGAKDFYVKVKDASGNVSTALKIEIPGYLPPMYPEPPPLPSNNGGIIYHNPDFPGIIIKIGGK